MYTDLAEKTNPKASGIARKPFQVFSAIPRFYWVSGLLERTAGIAEALLEERRCLCFLYSQPAIAPNYLSAQADQKVAAEAIRLTRRIAAQPALAAFRPEEFKPGPALQSEAELVRAAGDIGATIFHPVGTCRMGADPAAVVDPQLRLRGPAGLRIADASIMPTITSGNTNSPTLMIAEQAAALIKAAAKA